MRESIGMKGERTCSQERLGALHKTHWRLESSRGSAEQASVLSCRKEEEKEGKL